MTEQEIEVIENGIISIVDDKIKVMSKSDKTDLLEMLIDSLESLKDE